LGRKGETSISNGNNLAREAIKNLNEEVQRSIIGQEYVVERLIIALLANGNVLVEGLPGLAKTRSIKSIAKALEAGLSRIQFTPTCCLPTSPEPRFITVDGKGFRFQGLSSMLILADEIIRARQGAGCLIEAMEDGRLRWQGDIQASGPLHGQFRRILLSRKAPIRFPRPRWIAS
jgi:MoxR-like ATPase